MVRKLNGKLRDRFESERQDREARQRFEDKREQDRIEREKPKLHSVPLLTPISEFRWSSSALLEKLLEYNTTVEPFIQDDHRYKEYIAAIADREFTENYLKSIVRALLLLDYCRRRLTNDFYITGEVSLTTMMNVLKLVDQMGFVESCNLFEVEGMKYDPIKLVYNNFCGVNIFGRGYRFLERSSMDMEYNSGTPEQLFHLSKYIHSKIDVIKRAYTIVSYNITKTLEDK